MPPRTLDTSIAGEIEHQSEHCTRPDAEVSIGCGLFREKWCEREVTYRQEESQRKERGEDGGVMMNADEDE